MRGEFVRENVPDWPTYADREGLTLVGRGKWRSTLCGFHDDTNPSMRVSMESGGWSCMSCGASGGDTLAHFMQLHDASFIHAARALGAWKEGNALAKPHKPRALSARDGLKLLHHDAQVLWLVSGDILRGKTPSDEDREAAARAMNHLAVIFDGVNPA